MTKFLMAIMLLITCVKYTSACTVFSSNRFDFTKLALLQDEESKKEKGEQEKSKIENEDLIFPHSIISPTLNTSAKVLKISWQQDPYFAFVNSLNTPPPDTV